jgi:tripartite-type tricarboxylate transporter receptor subunit TctC
MHITRRNLLASSMAVTAASGFTATTAAQPDWPNKPIRFIVPSPPGGGTDTMTRLVGNRLTETLKWQFVPDNRPGAGGNLGLEAAIKAPPDGYTLVMGESSNLTINPFLYGKLPYDVEKDLQPVILVAKVPLVLVVGAATRFDSVAALTGAARQKPLSFASSGNGTVGHLVAEAWRRQLGVEMVHVPYKGGGPAITDVAGGVVDLHFASVPAALPLIKGGRVRPLAVTSFRRAALLPDVPSLAELGQRDFDNHVIYGVLVPAGTPQAIVTRLNTEINRVLRTPSVRETLTTLGADRELHGGTPTQFAAFLWHERLKWAKAVKESGAKVD